MQIILIQDVENLGQKGEVKEVPSGYGRNFLIPKGLAVLVSKGVLKSVEERLQAQKKKKEALKEKVLKMKQDLEKKTFKIEVKGGPKGKLFGSVTHKEIADIINKETDLEIDKKQIEEEPIKELGEHSVKIKLAEGIEAQIKLKIESKKKSVSKSKK